MLSSDMLLTPSNPSSALLSVFWNISAAEETPKLRRVYLRNATCVVNVVMFRESSLSSSGYMRSECGNVPGILT